MANTLGVMHQQLLGTWKSDRRKTFQTWSGYDQFTLSQKQKLGKIFGHLKIRYTDQFFDWKQKGETTRDKYKVIEEDSDSHVMRTYSHLYCVDVLHHLHFENIRGKSYYWIGFKNYSEWFRQIA